MAASLEGPSGKRDRRRRFMALVGGLELLSFLHYLTISDECVHEKPSGFRQVSLDKGDS